jgi:hypothetical protein
VAWLPSARVGAARLGSAERLSAPPDARREDRYRTTLACIAHPRHLHQRAAAAAAAAAAALRGSSTTAGDSSLLLLRRLGQFVGLHQQSGGWTPGDKWQGKDPSSAVVVAVAVVALESTSRRREGNALSSGVRPIPIQCSPSKPAPCGFFFRRRSCQRTRRSAAASLRACRQIESNA